MSPLWVHSVFSVWLKLPLTLTWATQSYWWVNYTPNRKVVFCSMDLLWWTCWLLHSHVYIFKYFSLCMHLYISAVMMSVWLKSQIKHFFSQKWAKANFPHINFGLALIYQNQKKFDRKGDPSWLSQQKIEVRAFLKTDFIGTVCTTFTF